MEYSLQDKINKLEKTLKFTNCIDSNGFSYKMIKKHYEIVEIKLKLINNKEVYLYYIRFDYNQSKHFSNYNIMTKSKSSLFYKPLSDETLNDLSNKINKRNKKLFSAHAFIPFGYKYKDLRYSCFVNELEIIKELQSIITGEFKLQIYNHNISSILEWFDSIHQKHKVSFFKDGPYKHIDIRDYKDDPSLYITLTLVDIINTHKKLSNRFHIRFYFLMDGTFIIDYNFINKGDHKDVRALKVEGSMIYDNFDKVFHENLMKVFKHENVNSYKEIDPLISKESNLSIKDSNYQINLKIKKLSSMMDSFDLEEIIKIDNFHELTKEIENYKKALVFIEKELENIHNYSNNLLVMEGEMNNLVYKQIKENISNFINVFDIFKSNYSLLSKYFVEKSKEVTKVG